MKHMVMFFFFACQTKNNELVLIILLLVSNLFLSDMPKVYTVFFFCPINYIQIIFKMFLLDMNSSINSKNVYSVLFNTKWAIFQIYHRTVSFGLVWFMVLNTTFNNISVISCLSVLWRKETGVPRENLWPVTSN